MAQDEDTPNESARTVGKLTATEKACLSLVQTGKMSKEIARELGLTPNSVDSAIRDACAKLGTRSRFIAAQFLADAPSVTEKVTVTNHDPKFRAQIRTLSDPTEEPDKGSSAGEGNGPGDLSQNETPNPKSVDFGAGRSWLREPHPLAKFFGGENRLSKGQRLVWIITIAVIVAIAYGGIVNGLLGISDLLSPP